MSDRSEAELINEILEKLSILPVGQTANSEDVGRVRELLPSIGPLLNALEIAYIPDFNNIPPATFIPLVALCAYVCREKFSIMGDEEAGLKSSYDEAVANMRVMFRGKPTYNVLRPEWV